MPRCQELSMCTQTGGRIFPRHLLGKAISWELKSLHMNSKGVTSGTWTIWPGRDHPEEMISKAKPCLEEPSPTTHLPAAPSPQPPAWCSNLSSPQPLGLGQQSPPPEPQLPGRTSQAGLFTVAQLEVDLWMKKTTGVRYVFLCRSLGAMTWRDLSGHQVWLFLCPHGAPNGEGAV